MAGRRNLMGVADGTLQSFVGRNNDVQGYWGIGVLCRFAREQRTSIVELDVLAREARPASMHFDGLLVQCRERLDRHVRALALAEGTVREVRIRITFEPTSRPHAASTRFHCVVAIVDDRGHAFARSSDGWCWAHDPARESRSGRVAGG